MNFVELANENVVYHHVRVQLWEHLKQRVYRALADGAERRKRILSPEDLESHAQALRAVILDHFGGWPYEVSGEPSCVVSGEIAAAGYKIQKLVLETRPRVFATANLYLPEPGSAPFPAVLFLCGHSVEGKAYDAYQSVCQRLVARGMVVLALDPTGQGERSNYFDPTTGELKIRAATGDHEYGGFQSLLLGQNLSRFMLHDAIRAIDYLVADPRIDASRIGVTGNSGGGTQASLLMALEPRLAAAAPATFLTTREAIFDSGIAQDSEQIWRGFTGLGYNHVDLVAAFAPKPVCLLAVTEDFFPIEGTRELVAEATRFWEMHDASGSFHAVEDRSLHGFTDRLALAAAEFFAGVFRTGGQDTSSLPYALRHQELICTRTGQVQGDFPEARTIHDENVAELGRMREDGLDVDAAKKFLHQAVFSNREVVAANLRVTQNRTLEGIRCRGGYWWSQKGLINSGCLFEPDFKNGSPELRPVTVALWEDGTSGVASHEDWIRQQVSNDRAVLVLNTIGTGPLTPNPINGTVDAKERLGAFFRFSDDLVTLDDSLAALRTFDVLRAVAGLSDWGGVDAETDVQIYADGPYGIYGVLASIIEPRLGLLPLQNPPPSFAGLVESEFYNDHDVKSLVIPGMVCHADWVDVLEGGSRCSSSFDRKNSETCQLVSQT